MCSLAFFAHVSLIPPYAVLRLCRCGPLYAFFVLASFIPLGACLRLCPLHDWLRSIPDAVNVLGLSECSSDGAVAPVAAASAPEPQNLITRDDVIAAVRSLRIHHLNLDL